MRTLSAPSESSECQPLLMKFAIARTGKQELPGRYDERRQVWTIETATGPEPIVKSAKMHNVRELATKTDVKAEQDDPGYSALVELITKTAHQTEKDDVSPRNPFFLELVTTTKVGGERPDIS